MYNRNNNTMKCPICGNNVADNELFCEFCGMRVNIRKDSSHEQKIHNNEVVSKSDTFRTFSEWSRHWAELYVENYEFWMYLVHEHIDDDDFSLPLIVCAHQFQSRQDMQDAYVCLCECGRDLGFGLPSDYVFLYEEKNQWFVFLPCSDLPAVLLVAEHYNGKICAWADYFIPMPTMPISMEKSFNIKSYRSSYAPVRAKMHIKNINLLTQRHLNIPSYKRINEPMRSVSTKGCEYIDLGLSVKWATCNEGAWNPEGYGSYYAWGEIYEKEEYTAENSLTRGKRMDDINGDSRYDAAARSVFCGRMPTEAELLELRVKCKWEWTTLNYVNGYKVTGPNGNSIFLPAAGYRYGTSLYDVGSAGNYWSSTPDNNDTRAFYLGFDSGKDGIANAPREKGFTIRSVG